MKNSETTSGEKELFVGDGAPAIWREAFCAALAGGFDNPELCADMCLKEFRNRFGEP